MIFLDFYFSVLISLFLFFSYLCPMNFVMTTFFCIIIIFSLLTGGAQLDPHRGSPARAHRRARRSGRGSALRALGGFPTGAAGGP
jgi:hypothetical protein